MLDCNPSYLPELTPKTWADFLVCQQGMAKGPNPGNTLWVLLPEAELPKLPALQAICRDRGAAMVGAVFPMLLAGGRFVDQGAVVVNLPAGTSTCLLGELPSSPMAAAARLADRLLPDLDAQPSGAPTTLFLVFDAMVGTIASVLDELYLRLANRVRYLGVNAGSERFVPMPCLFDQVQCLGNGVLALLLPEGEHALAHGYRAPRETLCATATQGNRIVSIDWQPAFTVYQDLVARRYGVGLTKDNFYQYGVHFPFGICLANGETLVRIPVALEEDGSIFCVGEVPANVMLTLLEAPEGASHDTVATLNEVAGAKPALTFYCAGRRMHLGDAAQEELALLGDTGRSPLGALSLGEIGNSCAQAYPRFHNAALVCLC